MPTVTHVRNEVWDEATKEFRLKSLPTVPDVTLVAVRDDVAAGPGTEVVLGSVVVPEGTVLRVTLLRYLTSDDRGALMKLVQGGSDVDYMLLPGAGEAVLTGSKESPIYVLEGTVEALLLTKFGSVYTGTVYGVVMHGYFSRQESLRTLT